EEALSRRFVCGQNTRDALLALAEVLLKVCAHELVLAAEGAIQRRLCDAGPFDNAVNTDHVHAFRVEQLVGGFKQAVPCGRAVRGLRFERGSAFGGLRNHGSTLTDRSVYRFGRQFRTPYRPYPVTHVDPSHLQVSPVDPVDDRARVRGRAFLPGVVAGRKYMKFRVTEPLVYHLRIGGQPE